MTTHFSTAALDRYIDRVRRIPTLSREDEHELAVLSAAGDREAGRKLVEANLRYVVAVALQYRRYGMPLSDLVAEGNVGLMTALEKFDPHRGTRFVTYAGYWIRAYVLESVVRSTSMVGGGSGPLRSKLFFRLRRERARIASLVLDPAERLREMAERFGTSEERMAELLARLDGADVSIDHAHGGEGDTPLVERLASSVTDAFTAVSDAAEQQRLGVEVESAMAKLDPRERFIVERRMLADDEVSLADLGRELGVSRERARQLEARARTKLQRDLRAFATAA